MASVNLSNLSSLGNKGLFRLDNVDLNSNTKAFRKKVSTKIDVLPSDYELIYCGQCLRDDKSLTYYNITANTTIFAINKTQDPPIFNEAAANEPSTVQLVSALQSALLNASYRVTVDRILNTPESVDNIFATTPGLSQDPVSLSMLQDPELLAILAHPSNIDKVIQKHPAFAQAALTIATAVNEEGAQENFSATTGTYSLDQMSDDDDVSMPVLSQQQMGGSAITASQLAEALAMATGSSSATAGQGSPSSSSASTSSSNRPVITPDFFHEAMMQASSTSLEGQLQQLRDMGISDDALARRALEATGGDIHAAIDLIFQGF